VDFEPRLGTVPDGSRVSRYYLSQVVLARVPVTKLSIHGLMVEYCHTRFFDDQAALERHIHQRAARP
jgi:hypothetical protein